jgi:hypothetical protein
MIVEWIVVANVPVSDTRDDPTSAKAGSIKNTPKILLTVCNLF